MTASIARIDAETEVARPRAARQRWEARQASGMRYLDFAPLAGGLEEIEIWHDGAVIGHMTSEHQAGCDALFAAFGGQDG